VAARRPARAPGVPSCRENSSRLLQHPDQHPSEHRVLLAVDERFSEGAALRVTPELDPAGAVEVGKDHDAQEFGAAAGWMLGLAATASRSASRGRARLEVGNLPRLLRSGIGAGEVGIGLRALIQVMKSVVHGLSRDAERLADVGR
jgi:hypothetical protein